MKGYITVDIVIVTCIGVIAIITALVMLNNHGSITIGINGITETRCINGYQFVIGEGGQARQVLDEFGKGARCPK